MNFAHFGRDAVQAVAMLIVTLLLSLSFAGSSHAMMIIGFDGFVHGEVVTDQIDGVTISALNRHRSFHYAVAFDSEARGTRDTDLQDLDGDQAWRAGNLSGQRLGRMLILQENDYACAGPNGICLKPDDEGNRGSGGAGILRFDFSIPVLSFGFDAIDIERPHMEDFTIDFFDFGTGKTATVRLGEYLAGGGLYDPDALLVLDGDNTANRFGTISVDYLGLSRIDRVEFNLGGSGALDNIRFEPVPEPSTALLLSLGLGTLAALRRANSTRGC